MQSERLRSCRAPEAIGKLLGLTAKSCSAEHAEPLSEKERERLRNQVPGWRVSSNDAGGLCLRYDWTAQVRPNSTMARAAI